MTKNLTDVSVHNSRTWLKQVREETKTRLSTPVFCLTLDKSFASAVAAARELGLDSSHITSCIKGYINHTCGYAFVTLQAFLDDDSDLISITNTNEPNNQHFSLKE